jgi:hypothetical protein
MVLSKFVNNDLEKSKGEGEITANTCPDEQKSKKTLTIHADAR